MPLRNCPTRMDRAMHNVNGHWTGLSKHMCRADSQIFYWRFHFLIQVIVLAACLQKSWRLCMQLAATYKCCI
jgi:hypothetical protein